MGQIVSSTAKPKRCNANQLSQVPTPAAGEHILVSSDNSMNAAGQGNFDAYVVGDGTTAAAALTLRKINEALEAAVFGVRQTISVTGTTTSGYRLSYAGKPTSSSASGYSIIVFPIQSGVEYTLNVPSMQNAYTALYGFANTDEIKTSLQLEDFLYENKTYTNFTGKITKSGYSYLFVCFSDAGGSPTLTYEASGTGLVDRVDDIEDEISSINGEISAQSERITSIEEELDVVKNFTENDVTDNYYYAYNGDSNAVVLTQSSSFECILIPVSAGDVITAKFVSGNNAPYYYGWYLLNANYIPLQKPSTTPIDYSVDPLVLNVAQDGYFVINCNKIADYYSADLDVSINKANMHPWDVEDEVLQQQIDNIEDEIAAINGDLEILIPDVVFGIVGTQMNLWNDAISLSADKGLASPANYQVKWICGKGLVTDRCFRFTPTASDVGDTSCTCTLYNVASGEEIAQKTFTIRVVANSAQLSAKRTVFFGDSLGMNTATELYTNFQTSALFTGTMPQMLGTSGADACKYEAIGGYGWFEYATSGRIAWRISVENVTALGIGAVYSDGTYWFEVREVNITGGTGNVLLIQATSHKGNLTIPSGTLTKVSGAGDASLAYTSGYQESANLLWNNGALDFANYRTSHLGLSSSQKLDAVFFQLGINGTEDETLLRNYINALYDAFVADNPSGLFVVGIIPSSGNDVNGSGMNYGASYDTIGYHKRVYMKNKVYLSLLADTTRPNFRISQQGLFVDRYYGYGLNSRPISSRVSQTEQYHVNYVHPTTSGYQQLADGLLGAYVALLSE